MQELVENPFNELPQALVEDLLQQCDSVSSHFCQSFEEFNSRKDQIREVLIQKNLLKRDSDILSSPFYPTTCGVDGAYAIERLLSTDLVVIASVAVEGLAPQNEARYWEHPHHRARMLTAIHNETMAMGARSVMFSKELQLAVRAPHDVVFLDGSFITPLIHFNQAFSQLDKMPENLSELLIAQMNETLNNYRDILVSKKSDKQYAAIPKYTTDQEIAKNFLNLRNFEDRAILSLLLDEGEYIIPMPYQGPKSDWHITSPDLLSHQHIDEIISAIRNLYIVYYRPFRYSPAIRLEIPASIAKNKIRLAQVFEAIKTQCASPGIMEPYPLYLADRMVKHLSKAVPAIRKTAVQEMLRSWEDSESDIYFLMHGYRTDWGK